MTKQYRSRHVTISDDDTKTTINELGSSSVSAQIQVPKGASVLEGVWAASGFGITAAAGQHAVYLRLEGDGLPTGEETLVIGGAGNDIATGNRSILPAQYYQLNVPVQETNRITPSAEFTGTATDFGNIEVGITLVFN